MFFGGFFFLHEMFQGFLMSPREHVLLQFFMCFYHGRAGTSLQLFLPNKVKIGLHYCVIITHVVKFVILFLLYMLPEASESD